MSDCNHQSKPSTQQAMATLITQIRETFPFSLPKRKTLRRWLYSRIKRKSLRRYAVLPYYGYCLQRQALWRFLFISTIYRGCSLKLLEFMDMELSDWQQRLDSGEVPNFTDVQKLGKLAQRTQRVLQANGLV